MSKEIKALKARARALGLDPEKGTWTLQEVCDAVQAAKAKPKAKATK